jgi:ElaB/YqjD/DUF883 family membrane-anchored ribosome-binding protein
MTTGVKEVTKEKLFQDLKMLVADSEELLRATANQAGEKISSARVRFEENLRHAKTRLDTAETAIADRTKEAAQMTDDYVKSNPWASVGIAGIAGLFIGLLIGRR